MHCYKRAVFCVNLVLQPDLHAIMVMELFTAVVYYVFFLFKRQGNLVVHAEHVGLMIPLVDGVGNEEAGDGKTGAAVFINGCFSAQHF